MTGLERRWARDLLTAFAPCGGRGLSPQRGEVDYLTVFQRLRIEATPRAAFGLRLAIWITALAPIWMWGRLRTSTQLRAPMRTALLRQLLAHRLFAVRELTTLLKLAAALALLGTPSVRERSGYDAVQASERVESGVRVKLPVVDSDVEEGQEPKPAQEVG